MRGQMAHLDAEVLAEFRAGLITGRRGASITAHLAGCDRCTALGDQFAGVSALLAAVPVPAIPDLVAQRLDTVLAAEAARLAAGAPRLTAGAASPDHAERARADRPGHRATGHRRTPHPGFRRPSFRLLSARVLAPVAVVLLAAGGYGLSRAIGPGSHAATSSVKAAPSAASPAQNRDNGPASGPARAAQGTVPRPQRITSANFTLVASTTNFAPATLKRQVENELGRAAPAEGSGAAQPVTVQLRACVQNLTHDAGLIRVESARFAGQPATLVVARKGPDEVAWIAGPDCSATSRDVLATTSVP
ncbi:MAG TPA: hypothetical protein VGU21_02095 [Streptosporangiaceae bacterium]|nr:hypothetical protein [Streptosporangiaceae bacterium]